MWIKKMKLHNTIKIKYQKKKNSFKKQFFKKRKYIYVQAKITLWFHYYQIMATQIMLITTVTNNPLLFT